MMLNASGRPLHNATNSVTAAVSAATRDVPILRVSSAWASSSQRVSSARWRAPCRVVTPASQLRLVTTTAHVPPPGSSGATWAVSTALSSTSSIRLVATRLRNSDAWACG